MREKAVEEEEIQMADMSGHDKACPALLSS